MTGGWDCWGRGEWGADSGCSPSEGVSEVPAILAGDNGVFLFDIAKVKEEVPDIVTWAEVMWRFPGGLFNGSKVKEEPADSWATVLVGLLVRENHECGCPALGQLVHEGGTC